MTSLQGSCLLVFCLYLALKAYILLQGGSNVVTSFPNGLLMPTYHVIYHFVTHLLPSMWKHHITAVPPEVFIHLLHIDLHIIFREFFNEYPAFLLKWCLMMVVCSLWFFTIFQCFANFLSTIQSLSCLWHIW